MSDKKIKICGLIHSLCPGGMERVMSELVASFTDRKNVEVHLVLYGIKRDVFYPIPDTVILHRPDFEFNNSFRTLYSIKTLFYLRKQVKKIDPDTVLSFGELWNNFALLALLGLGIPVYVSDRCSPEKKLGRLHEFLRKILYPKAEGIIAQTAKAKEIYLQKFHHPNIKVIGNPIRPFGSNHTGEMKENIVLSVGRLIKSKHHDKLIELFLDIDLPGWNLVIVGGDAQKQNGMERLQKLVKKRGAESKVLLEGYQADIESYYHQSKIFAFTSSSEGFPNVIGEAMSAGLPVVAFDCVAGPSEMIEDGKSGYLVPLFNYENFKIKLHNLMDDEKLRIEMGRSAKSSIQEYSLERIGEKYFQFICDKFISEPGEAVQVLNV